MMKWVYCTKEVNGVIKRKWREPKFWHDIKWWYKLNILGWKKYLKGDR